MKPYRILLIGLSFCAILVVLSFFLPERIHLFHSFTLRFPSAKFWVSEKKITYKDITPIIRLSEFVKDSFSVKVTPKIDSLPEVQKQLPKANTIKNSDSLRSFLQNMEYPSGMDSLLFGVFRDLYQLPRSSNLIRIIHYGDSQIEGDRITSYLRNQLQLKFGGSGVGMFPVVSLSPASSSYVYNITDNWQRFSINPTGGQYTADKKTGVLMNYCRFDPASGNVPAEAGIDLKRANIAFSTAHKFRQCRLFYRTSRSNFTAEGKIGSSNSYPQVRSSGDDLKEICWQFSQPVSHFSIRLKADTPPVIYGIALDDVQGVAIDNVPMRGSTGVEFSRLDMNFLKQFYQLLNVKLIVFQFGVNLVPNTALNIHLYENNLIHQINTLKKSCPDISIIIIGVSDVSINGEHGYESCPNVVAIRDAQKRAAFTTGCAFWDMYEAMGGQNSMPSWVNANPALAQKDFVHLNPLGAKIIGEMFFRSFMNEYDRFLISQSVDKLHD